MTTVSAYPTASRHASSNRSYRSAGAAAAPDWASRCARKSPSCMAGASACTRASATAPFSTSPCRSDASPGAVEHLQQRRGLGIRLAIEAGRAVLHLEGGEHVASLFVQLTVTRNLVTLLRQRRLKPGDIR